jgi:hypothetical protein
MIGVAGFVRRSVLHLHTVFSIEPGNRQNAGGEWMKAARLRSLGVHPKEPRRMG